jgi:hypothetical protein
MLIHKEIMLLNLFSFLSRQKTGFSCADHSTKSQEKAAVGADGSNAKSTLHETHRRFS